MKSKRTYDLLCVLILASLTTSLHAACEFGSDTCLPGFVWREASPADHVCVTGATRDQTRNDNALANQRRSPTGGPYGPDTCLPGFVWREALPTDRVCVPGSTRTQAAADNAQANARRDPQCIASQVCASSGGPPITHIDENLIAIAQSPGRKKIGYGFQNGRDAALLVIDDAPGLRRDQVRIEIDIDPASGVDQDKAIEAWTFCHRNRVNIVSASLSGGFGVGVACLPLSSANDFRSGCTRTQSMLLDRSQSQASDLWLRKPGFFGFWYDVEVIDSSFWSAFGGRSVRFIWRFD